MEEEKGKEEKINMGKRITEQTKLRREIAKLKAEKTKMLKKKKEIAQLLKLRKEVRLLRNPKGAARRQMFIRGGKTFLKRLDKIVENAKV